MTVETILVPDIGDYQQVPVIEIHVKSGTSILADAPLITLETEKATMEIPAPRGGKVTKVLVTVGQKVSCGDPILELEGAPAMGVAPITLPTVSEQAASITMPMVAKPAAAALPTPPTLPIKVTSTANVVTPSSGSVHAGPATRRLARELGVDLAQLVGTGKNNRITTVDVQQHVKAALASGGVATASKITLPDFKKFGEVTEVPLSRIKKLTARNMQRNWNMIPHVTQFGNADITELEQFRLTEQAKLKEGKKLTLLVFIMKAIVATLKHYPQFNSSLSADGEKLIQKQYYHLGIAVDTPQGLVVPVIRNVDKQGLLELVDALTAISAKARESKLTPSEMEGQTFTISSLGGIGGTAFTPIINAPDVAILGISQAAWMPHYQDGQFVPRLTLPLSLSYDHRVIDGAEAARFMVKLASYLSDVRTLLL